MAVAGPAMAIDSFDYQPPERGPKGELSRFVPENPDLVLEQVWAFIEQQGFALESVDPQERLLVARYSGDPRPYVDCGLVTALDDGVPADPPRQYSANKPEVRTAKAPKGRRVGLLREHAARRAADGPGRAARRPGRGCSRARSTSRPRTSTACARAAGRTSWSTGR